MSPLLIVIGVIAFLMILGAGIAIVATGGNRDVEGRLEQFVGNFFGCRNRRRGYCLYSRRSRYGRPD